MNTINKNKNKIRIKELYDAINKNTQLRDYHLTKKLFEFKNSDDVLSIIFHNTKSNIKSINIYYKTCEYILEHQIINQYLNNKVSFNLFDDIINYLILICNDINPIITINDTSLNISGRLL